MVCYFKRALFSCIYCTFLKTDSSDSEHWIVGFVNRSSTLTLYVGVCQLVGIFYLNGIGFFFKTDKFCLSAIGVQKIITKDIILNSPNFECYVKSMCLYFVHLAIFRKSM